MLDKVMDSMRALAANGEFSRYFRNTLWLFGDKFVRLGLNFFVVVMLSRYLGPDQYGLLSYSQSLIGIFLALSSLGLDVVIVRELARAEKNANRILGTALTLKLLASSVSICLLLIFGHTFSSTDSSPITNILAFCLIFQNLGMTIDAYFQSKVLSRFSSITNMLSGAISAAIKLWLIYIEADLIIIVYIVVFEHFLTFSGYLFFFVRATKRSLPFTFDWADAKSLMSSAWPLLMVAMSVFIYTKIDMLMLKNMMGNASAGYYSAAARTIEVFYIFPALIAQSIFPKLVQLKQKSEIEYLAFLQKTLFVMVWVAILVSAIVAALSEYLVVVLYGQPYVPSIAVLEILSIAIILNTIGIVSTKVLYVEHYERKYLVRSLVGVFTNITLNILLIPRFGTEGAAWASIITLLVIFYLFDVFDRDLAKFLRMKLTCIYTYKAPAARLK